MPASVFPRRLDRLAQRLFSRQEEINGSTNICKMRVCHLKGRFAAARGTLGEAILRTGHLIDLLNGMRAVDGNRTNTTAKTSRHCPLFQF
jgi:hypothetical protein